jgi:RNA 3'-terminal phosphate cyclase (ATP)
MIEIDGSFGEGGGQIIRTALALAAVTGKEVEIKNIRAGRPNPGLSAQHVHAARAVEILSGGTTEGLKIRSTRLQFSPAKLKGFVGDIDIGTAGSITLLLQALIPVALFAESETKVQIQGGTDVKWSPPIDFYTHVFLEALRQMGCEVYLGEKRRGYYPKGGGLVEVRVAPSHYVKRLAFEEQTSLGTINGVSHSCGLPFHVAERQAKAAERLLHTKGYSTVINRDIETGSKRTTGCGITLWCDYKSGSALGARGKRAELVGREAAKILISELESPSTVDAHLADQLIPYIALAEGKSEIKVKEITNHLKTNIYVTKRFLDVEFEIEKERGIFVIRRK